MISGSVSVLPLILYLIKERNSPCSLTSQERIEEVKLHFNQAQFSREDYINHFKTISSATSSRDLKTGVEVGFLIKIREMAQTVYQYRDV